MNRNSPVKAVIVVTITALLCSMLVTIAAVTMQPIQRAYQDLERNRFLVGVSGLTDSHAELSDRDIVKLFQMLEAKIVDLHSGKFDDSYNPDTFDSLKIANDPGLSIPIPKELDVAKLSRRSRLVTVYLVRDGRKLQRLILPIYGQGMWSTIYGFIALEEDLNTIADITFYEQAETAGIGDKILHPDWQAGWRGRKLYDETGTLRFKIRGSAIALASAASQYQVDGITGATVTADAVTNLMGYWFGPHGFAPFVRTQRAEEDQ